MRNSWLVAWRSFWIIPVFVFTAFAALFVLFGWGYDTAKEYLVAFFDEL